MSDTFRLVGNHPYRHHRTFRDSGRLIRSHRLTVGNAPFPLYELLSFFSVGKAKLIIYIFSRIVYGAYRNEAGADPCLAIMLVFNLLSNPSLRKNRASITLLQLLKGKRLTFENSICGRTYENSFVELTIRIPLLRHVVPACHRGALNRKGVAWLKHVNRGSRGACDPVDGNGKGNALHRFARIDGANHH